MTDEKTNAVKELRPSDDEILKYERTLKDVEAKKPIISDQISTDYLKTEYKDSPFISKIINLTKKYKFTRTTRRDGNCFYRGFGFGLAELIKKNKETAWGKAAVEKVLQTKQLLLDVGYDLYAIEDFYDVFTESVLSDDFEKEFRTEYICDTIVCFLRLITAAYLKKNVEMFESFVLDLYPSLEIFISSQVEPMNVEADNVQIVALVNALGTKVKIANLDSSVASDGSENYHDFEPMEIDSSFETPTVVFLFRPGHYDLLY